MRVHLVDGTYELFRHFFGAPPRTAIDGTEVGAARGVVSSVVAMLEGGATHLGVATDHVIESFRNELWPGYKTGEGVPPELAAQFGFLERALGALGAHVWPMVELEADDALASAAAVAAEDRRVDQVLVCTPDKDLAQCVVGTRVVQLDRRAEHIIDEAGVWEKFGVAPRSIADFLALVGDSADGFPGLAGWGRKSAASVLAHYERLAAIPDDVESWEPELRRSVRGAPKLAERLAADRQLAELFLDLATLRVDRSLLGGVDELAWHGPTDEFDEVCAYMADLTLVGRVAALAHARGAGA
ncbi:MAG TPA: 5'-3' exonuclease H3TH domain-containing protein [Acidimicrobiales bacterium]|nr:5'-3' exonuclease H3TH domain-containing protein [Acidimicrobiales bacterium]